MLAAVALHVLVTEGRKGMTDVQVASACERDPTKQAEMREIKAALLALLRDGLAERNGDLFKPTRAAARAAELSF
jgi:hypothetical protein